VPGLDVVDPLATRQHAGVDGGDPGAPAREPAHPLASGVTAIRGARSELRRQLREQRRLRMVTLALVSLLVLGALPLYFGIRAATRDPVFNSLDALDVPSWATTKTEDRVDGSRWCIMECRFRERSVESQRAPDETARVYEGALAAAGWQRWKVAQCPDQPVDGHYTCWQRDEYTLDLWVRKPECAYDPLRLRPTVGPSGAPAAGPSAAVPCTGAAVSIKVRNRIDDERGRPQPSQDPSLTGEQPDPIFTDDPLEATPAPS
jgi:integrin beta 3